VSDFRTKYEILLSRVLEAEHALANANADLANLERPCLNDRGEPMRCTGCGAQFKTERDFASHYLVPDERYINLGACPSSIS
jgi:hypothetical protein